MNDPLNESNQKTVLTYLRRLEKAIKKIVDSDDLNYHDLFVTNDHRYYMNEIAKVDPGLLDTTVRQFINDSIAEKVKNIFNLRELFTETLISAYTNLPGYSDEDEEWFSQDKDSHLSSSLSSLSLSSSTKKLPPPPPPEPKFESPWATKNNFPTKMPEKYKNYIEGISFLGIYEIVRILKPFGPIEPTSNFWNQIICGTVIYKLLYEECKKYYSSKQSFYHEMPKIMNRSLSAVWALNSKESSSTAGSRVHVIFSGNVELHNNRLNLTLNPPKIGNSKRYYRLFSSERFFHIKINVNMNNWDNKQRSSLKRLLLNPLLLAGRKYEFLYAKSGTLFYFATSGSDLPNSISIKEAINRNLPIELNKNHPTAKFYSRISLGFSDSTPTIIFKQNEIRHVEDIIIDGNCFTDGCSAISIAAMKEVADILGCEETPCAIQGRIGGAKGIWYIEPRRNMSGNRWIELRKSQTKYDVTDNDHLRTLEIVNIIVPPKTPATLNSQFIRVLNHGGVSVEVFQKMVRNDIEKIKSEVVGCDDPYSLITWVTTVSNTMKRRLDQYDYSDDGISINNGNSLSGFPNNPSEQCIQMLQAGFIPSACPFLAKKLKCVLSFTLKSLFNKFHINVSLSRVLICIADPTETLEPGEVFIQLDKEAGLDQRTGLSFGIIEDEIIIARNPTMLPSDIVKVKAVKNEHLSIYYNVVIFPVKAIEGDISLASYLSGGDYDGDKVFCCWDPEIVKNFKSTPILPIDPKIKSAFIKNNQTIDELLSSGDEIEFKMQEFVMEYYFRDLEPTLGLYDRWHRLQSSKFGMSDKSSIYLGQMCAALVDSTKHGLVINPSVKKNDDEMFGKLPVPYWMEKGDGKNRDRSNFGVTSIMDLLCITIEKEMKEINSKEFSVVVNAMDDPVDPHIHEFWNNELTRAQSMEEEGLAYKEDLDLIYSCASEIINMYNSEYSNIFNSQKEIDQLSKSNLTTNPSNKLNDKFRVVDNKSLVKFLSDPPVEKYKSSIFKFLKNRGPLTNENMDPLAVFELQLKAASLYLSSVKRKPAGQDCWVIAFRILCNIKSQMIDKNVIGGPRSIIDDIWQSMKVDKRWIKCC